jgi:GTP-binding protein HflX
LAHTAGANVVGQITQRMDRPTPFYLGRGKLEELKALVAELDAEVVIFDDELTPSQQGNLERELLIKVLDRTSVILDVFGSHASTKEGRLQVELAQYEYLLPRLAGQWTHLERLGGGIGTRGPGESQLETDRRLVRGRIQRLKGELDLVRRHRSRYRERRRAAGISVVSLVGYTNAGKSTLFNALSKATVTAQDQLFSTLDPITRRIQLPDGRPVLLTDTVGFIQKLSHGLVAAFRATLEELQEASIILHVGDITHPNSPEQAQVVEEALKDLAVDKYPRIRVLNKIDLLPPASDGRSDASDMVGVRDSEVPTVVISAHRKWGLDDLLHLIEAELERTSPQVASLWART